MIGVRGSSLICLMGSFLGISEKSAWMERNNE